MNVMTEPFGPADPAAPAQYRIYAKYPFGYPLMAAIGLALGGFDGLFWVNPLCTILACYFAYFLFRQVVSPFMSLLGVAWLACNPLVLIYADDSNSHASTLFCVCVGFWGLLSWMRTRQNTRAWIGGFALGYACTIRYSEFLLVLPVVFAALLHLRLNRPRIRPIVLLWFALTAIALEAWAAQWISFGVYEHMQAHWLALEIIAATIVFAAAVATIIFLRPTLRSLIGSLSLLCAWATPVGALAGVCWVCFGQPWKTGYAYDHESTGFAWKYLTGDLGHGMIRQGNWETLITQLNHTGLFVLWPLALAGIFALLGSAWRLGTLIALWVLPSTGLYMLYYWAPTGEITVGYMRFFMSVMPGLILAGLWILDRGLVVLKGERRASLLAITAFGFALLIAAALYVEGDALQLGPAIFSQIATALWHLASETKIGFYGVLLVLTLLAGIWLFDFDLAAEKTGLALGAGILTAIGCAMNLYNIAPQVERNYNMAIGLRLTIDNLREHVPKGSVIFAGDYSLNQIDALNDWKLFNANLFTPAAFNSSKLRVARGNKDNGEDPDPIQLERSQFYMQLLGTQDPRSHAWTVKKTEALRAMEFAIIAKNIDDGRRVFFLSQDNDPNSSPFGGGTINRPGSAGYIYKPHPFRWVAPSANALPDIPNALRRKVRPQPLAAPSPQSPPRGDVYQLYEIIKSPPKASPTAATR